MLFCVHRQRRIGNSHAFFLCVHGMRTNTYIHRYKKDDGDGDGDGDGTEEGHEDTAPQQEPFAGAADDTPLVV